MKQRPQNPYRYSQRQLRVIEALLLAIGWIDANKCECLITACQNHNLTPQLIGHIASSIGGWISREAIDRIAAASNGPEVIRQLRKHFGWHCIETKRVPKIDSDGATVHIGYYRVTMYGIRPLLEALQSDD